MKDSVTNIDNAVILNDTFSSEYNTRALNAFPSNVIFSKGLGVFISTSSSKIIYPIVLIQSLVIKLNTVTTFYCKLSSTRSVSITGGVLTSSGFTSPIYYVNGVLSTIVPLQGDVFITITDSVKYWTKDFQFGYSGSTYSTFKAEQIIGYSRILPSSEVKNLYNNKTNISLPKVINSTKKLILDVNAKNGIVSESSKLVTNTSVVVSNDGVSRVLDFGSTSKLDFGTFSTLIGDLTFNVYFKPKSLTGTIFDNGKLKITLESSNRIGVTSNNSTVIYSASNSFTRLNKVKLSITRTSSGIVNIYINGILSGTSNQNSGTPTAGTTNIFVGIISSIIYNVQLWDCILSLEEINQSNTSLQW